MSLTMVNYSEKALAVFGNTKEVKEKLKELGGKFNPHLRHGGVKTAGWIFSKKRQIEIQNFVGQIVNDTKKIEENTRGVDTAYIDQALENNYFGNTN